MYSARWGVEQSGKLNIGDDDAVLSVDTCCLHLGEFCINHPRVIPLDTNSDGSSHKTDEVARARAGRGVDSAMPQWPLRLAPTPHVISDAIAHAGFD
ncbi:unnamed protein product, partial [Iphiclides podalirius]